jgi:hypothetical protein
MRGNAFIDYTQLGLPYQLYACEILFNKAICRAQMYDTVLLPSFHADLKQSHHYLNLLQLPPYHETHYRITACMNAITVNQVKSFKMFGVPQDIYYSPSEALMNAVSSSSPVVQITRRVVLASPLLTPEDAKHSGFSGRKLKVRH